MLSLVCVQSKNFYRCCYCGCECYCYCYSLNVIYWNKNALSHSSRHVIIIILLLYYLNGYKLSSRNWTVWNVKMKRWTHKEVKSSSNNDNIESNNTKKAHGHRKIASEANEYIEIQQLNSAQGNSIVSHYSSICICECAPEMCWIVSIRYKMNTRKRQRERKKNKMESICVCVCERECVFVVIIMKQKWRMKLEV